MSKKNAQKSRVKLSSQGYDLYAKFYDKTLQFLNSFEKGKLVEFCGDLNGKKVLDIGCGTGREIGLLKAANPNPKTSFTAADISDEMLKITKRRHPDVETIKADMNSTPFKDEEFDVVIAAFVIVHVKNLHKAFKEIDRILKPGGIFILTNINQRKAPKLQTENEKIVIKSFYHIPEHVIEALKESFFEIEKEEFVEENGTWINQIVRARKI
jgi:ubiquinone/menaquinone biosynthesis C-methylase UbiE